MKHKLLIGVFALIILIGGGFLIWKKPTGGAASLLSGIGSLCKPGEYKYVTQWGTSGTGNGQFGAPMGITADTAGNIYVLDRQTSKIQKFTSNGVYIAQWGGVGNGNGRFNGPYDITSDSSNNLYVQDAQNDLIQKIGQNGSFINQWSLGPGTLVNSFHFGIATDTLGNVYATSDGDYVKKFSPNGVYITRWGGNGTANGMFYNASGIAVDSANNVYVVDRGNNRVQKFTSNGVYVTQWGGIGSGNGQFTMPSDIAVDSANNVYVVDVNNRVQKFTSNGVYITKWGTSGTGSGQFNIPFRITADLADNIYVTDLNNHRVQKFAPCTQLSAQIVPIKSISGKVYGDRNTNGVFDGTDNKLAGVKIDLYKVGQTVPLQSMTTPNVPNTDPTAGTYSFNNLPDGSYYVMINNEADYSSITQPSLSSVSVLGHVRFYFITITNGQGVINKDFGVVQKILS